MVFCATLAQYYNPDNKKYGMPWKILVKTECNFWQTNWEWFTKCSWAHVVISFLQPCVWHSDKSHSILACEQLSFSGMPFSYPIMILSPVANEPAYLWHVPNSCLSFVAPFPTCPCNVFIYVCVEKNLQIHILFCSYYTQNPNFLVIWFVPRFCVYRVTALGNTRFQLHEHVQWIQLLLEISSF